ncbi:MAG: hypothetical protein JETCAE03_35840 [Ignavibacteriaceae bacterium]|jgi:hypothetical protein|nr:MAG: hypothetical protein JETCAE03_35840 [Ignavibacteriaceae bacterium]
MKKIIFLDVDGVLNSEVDYLLNNKDIDERTDLAKRPMELLNDLIAETGAEVVISSTWRLGETVESMQKMFDEKGFRGKIIGLTERLGRGNLRGNEILQWIKDNQEYLDGKYYSNFDTYVIFDDDSDMLLWQKDNFIQIDSYAGLTYNKTYKAKHILNKYDKV